MDFLLKKLPYCAILFKNERERRENMFLTALGVVSTMLIYAIPGFILVKTKMIKGDSISAFAKVQMFVCSPCLIVYSMTKNDFSEKLVWDMVIAFLIILGFLLFGVLLFRLIFKNKKDDVRYRIYNLATTLANCAFMGVPILEALLPDYPQAVTFSAMFSLVMNILCWSLGSYIISNDKKYISIKKILLNPALFALIVAIPLFVLGVKLDDIPLIGDMVILLSKMTTPLCMLIVGMRLACASLKKVFFTPMQYLIIGIKQILFPLFVLLVMLILPIDEGMKKAIYIMMCCPVASVVLNFSEMIGEGQESAANLVLLSTLLSALTIPLMVLLI